MRELEWSELAQADLLAIVDYIASDNPDAAQRLKDNLDVKVEKLREFPGLFRQGRVKGTREMVARTNYIVVYAEDASRVRIPRAHPARAACGPTMATHGQVAGLTADAGSPRAAHRRKSAYPTTIILTTRIASRNYVARLPHRECCRQDRNHATQRRRGDSLLRVGCGLPAA